VPTPSSSADRARALAFRTHVEPELEVMLRVARTLTGSPTDAEDLVQETVIRAFRALDRFDGAHPRAWLLTTLRNTNMNMHRRQRPDLVEDWTAVQGAKPAFGALGVPSPEDAVVDQILNDDLERAEVTGAADPAADTYGTLAAVRVVGARRLVSIEVPALVAPADRDAQVARVRAELPPGSVVSPGQRAGVRFPTPALAVVEPVTQQAVDSSLRAREVAGRTSSSSDRREAVAAARRRGE
jgi:DNA-directed RNA polymerase specialized sigma24 family protein